MADRERARRDDAAFAEMIGQRLAPFQRVELATPVTCVLGARQMGKSHLIAIKALRVAVTQPGRHVLLASSSEEGSRRLIERCRIYARGHAELAASFADEQLGRLEFSNGSVIRAIATSETSARGWVAHGAFIDEAQLLSQAFVDALLPTLAATGGRVMLCGTAGVAEGAFYDLCRQGEVGSEHVRLRRWVPRIAGGADDAPWISASVIEMARQTMTPQRFGAEFRAEFASGSDAVFPLPILRAATADYRTTPLEDFAPAARCSMGIDWGERADRTCAVALARFAGLPAFGVASVRRWSAGASLPAVVSEIAGTPMHLQAVFAERNGIGAGVIGHLWQALVRRPVEAGGGLRARRVVLIEESKADGPFAPRSTRRRAAPAAGFTAERHAVFTTAAMKSSVFGSLRLMLESGELLLPAGEVELLSELMHLRAEITATGERISGAPHDDLAMSLGLACAPIPDRQKRGDAWRCRIAELARGQVPPAAIPPQLAGAAKVRGESGVEVPRTPVWQSVLGGELTLPEDFDRTPAESPLIRRAREKVAVELQRQRREEEALSG